MENTTPRDEKIIHRIFKGADLTARDTDGHTILHKAIIHDQPESIVRMLLSLGADIAARDCTGKTARDIAVKREKQQYCKCIDEFIIKLVKDRRCADIEKLILHNYDHILDITDSSNKKLVDIAKRHGNQSIHEVVRLTAAIQVSTTAMYKTRNSAGEVNGFTDVHLITWSKDV